VQSSQEMRRSERRTSGSAQGMSASSYGRMVTSRTFSLSSSLSLCPNAGVGKGGTEVEHKGKVVSSAVIGRGDRERAECGDLNGLGLAGKGSMASRRRSKSCTWSAVARWERWARIVFNVRRRSPSSTYDVRHSTYCCSSKISPRT
jgi:hypothetical protein